jgi:integrase
MLVERILQAFEKVFLCENRLRPSDNMEVPKNEAAMLLRDFFFNRYVPRRLRGKSQNSIRLYELCLRQFGRTLGRDPEVSDLTEENVFAHLARRCGVAPATRNKELSQLTALWRFAAQHKLISTWPDIDAEPEPERTPIAWMPHEVHAILRSAKRQTVAIGAIRGGDWWTGLLSVIFDTGERISAVTATRWDWIQSDWLTVKAEARKGKTRDRQYRLHPNTLIALDNIRKQTDDREHVFPWPYTPNYLWDRYKKIVSGAGLPTSREHAFHAIRKTVGSAVYAAGLDPQDALDHSDRRTTQRYLDPRFRREKHASDVLADFLRQPDKCHPSKSADLRKKTDRKRDAS